MLFDYYLKPKFVFQCHSRSIHTKKNIIFINPTSTNYILTAIPFLICCMISSIISNDNDVLWMISYLIPQAITRNGVPSINILVSSDIARMNTVDLNNMLCYFCMITLDYLRVTSIYFTNHKPIIPTFILILRGLISYIHIVEFFFLQNWVRILFWIIIAFIKNYRHMFYKTDYSHHFSFFTHLCSYFL